MKNKKDISSLKGLRINGQSYLLQTFCPLSGQTRVSLGTTCLEKNCPQKALGAVSKDIFNRKVRQAVAKIAKG